MATYSITEVHMERAPDAKHNHIARVRLLGSGTDDYSREAIINAIYGGDVFYTYATPPAQVYVHPCPECYDRDYITTHPDYTPKNNLLDLPRY